MTNRVSVEEGCTCAEGHDEHSCPYQVDVNDDQEFMCRCCPRCMEECVMDI